MSVADFQGIILTLGTTPLDKLIRAWDLEALELPIDFRIGYGSYLPSSGPWLRFTKKLFEYYCTKRWLVATHAGAGSGYSLLESVAIPLVVPNFERIDKHRGESPSYVEHNRFDKFYWKTGDIGERVDSYLKEDPVSFRPNERKPFGLPDDLLDAMLGV